MNYSYVPALSTADNYLSVQPGEIVVNIRSLKFQRVFRFNR